LFHYIVADEKPRKKVSLISLSNVSIANAACHKDIHTMLLRHKGHGKLNILF